MPELNLWFIDRQEILCYNHTIGRHGRRLKFGKKEAIVLIYGKNTGYGCGIHGCTGANSRPEVAR